MEFVQTEGEFSDDMADQFQNKAGAVAVEQDRQAAAQGIIVEDLELLGCQAERGWVVAGGPVTEAIDRLPGEQQVLDQDNHSLRDRQQTAPILVGQIRLQNRFQIKSLEEVVDDRQGTHGTGTQRALV